MSTQIPTHERQARLTFFLPNIIKMGKKSGKIQIIKHGLIQLQLSNR
jgi:hypothetical protein